MAQLNITLNQEEILQLLSNDRDYAFKKLLQHSLNSILKAESTEQLKAENQMQWLRQMNSIRDRAEIIICSELIYD